LLFAFVALRTVRCVSRRGNKSRFCSFDVLAKYRSTHYDGCVQTVGISRASQSQRPSALGSPQLRAASSSFPYDLSLSRPPTTDLVVESVSSRLGIRWSALSRIVHNGSPQRQPEPPIVSRHRCSPSNSILLAGLFVNDCNFTALVGTCVQFLCSMSMHDRARVFFHLLGETRIAKVRMWFFLYRVSRIIICRGFDSPTIQIEQQHQFAPLVAVRSLRHAFPGSPRVMSVALLFWKIRFVSLALLSNVLCRQSIQRLSK
jgi:hypothetical protein